MMRKNKGEIWIVETGVELDARTPKDLEPYRMYSREKLQSSQKAMFSDSIEITPMLVEGKMEEWIRQVCSELEDGNNILFITPLPADVDNVALKLRQIKDVNIHISKGCEDALDLPVDALAALSDGWVNLDGISLQGRYYPPFSPSQAAMVYTPAMAGPSPDFKAMLLQVYDRSHSLFAKSSFAKDAPWSKTTVEKLVTEDWSVLLIPPRSSDASLESFAGVIAQLRAPNGCPWDRKQTHESLRTYLLEETYEALDSIDSGDMPGLREELGDLFLQILLHAQIAEEKGEFTLSEILESINRKIVFRHPHVFGEVKVRDDREVVQNWEKLKEKERSENGIKEEFGILNGVPKAFPALAQAQSIQDRAARVGFDWDAIEPVKAKVMEEYSEVETAPDAAHRAKELGDLLFAVVNLVRWYKVDAESALRETNQKFRDRFAYIEKKTRETGRELSEMTFAEMDVYWEEAKHLDRSISD